MNLQDFIGKAVEEIRTQAGGEKVVMALSGGVDSSVCAALASRAIGERLVPIYVDTGLMRKGETERITRLFGNLPLHVVRAEERFFAALKGVEDPEEKRKQIGEQFIRVFEQ
ncbi:MAG: glutamine-hydrolyzing GMP synthase subunit GuaA, partial [Methanomicrobiales archaeon]|nr:glutamine-hydrolyzing GMP synthase subunit GuaA [Methanomicrobiales archaeon]